MKRIAVAVLLLSLPTAATAQTGESRDFAAQVEVVVDAETGAVVARTFEGAEVKRNLTYAAGSQSALAFWVEARKPVTGPVEIRLVGQRLRFLLPKEAPRQREFGPSDPSEPAFVGSPWKEVDLRYRAIEIECVSDAYWCSQIWFLEVIIPNEVVRAFISNPKKKNLPVALSKRKKVEWRTSRAEMVAVLDKLGVLAEFSN